MTRITLINGAHLETHIPLEKLYDLCNLVRKGTILSPVIIEVFHAGKKGGLDIRKIDPDATFTPAVEFQESVAA